MEEYSNETAELTLSLDVIFHLIEDNVYAAYMNRLFDSSEKYVAIYSSDTEDNPENYSRHFRNRNFSQWVAENKKEWRLHSHVKNKYPFTGDPKVGSLSDFYFYTKA